MIDVLIATYLEGVFGFSTIVDCDCFLDSDLAGVFLPSSAFTSFWEDLISALTSLFLLGLSPFFLLTYFPFFAFDIDLILDLDLDFLLDAGSSFSNIVVTLSFDVVPSLPLLTANAFFAFVLVVRSSSSF